MLGKKTSKDLILTIRPIKPIFAKVNKKKNVNLPIYVKTVKFLDVVELTICVTHLTLNRMQRRRSGVQGGGGGYFYQYRSFYKAIPLSSSKKCNLQKFICGNVQKTLKKEFCLSQYDLQINSLSQRVHPLNYP